MIMSRYCSHRVKGTSAAGSLFTSSGQLLAVDQVEQGDDPADEVGRLAADVTLPVDQQLIEEGEGLGLWRTDR